MKATRIISMFPVLLLCAASAAWGDGIPVEPGKWEISSTINMPMLPQPRVTTTTECFEKSEISIEDIGAEGMDPNCTFDTSQLDSNTLKWSFDCPMEGGTSHGEWEATSGGDTVTGEGMMTVSMQGHTMEMTMVWSGKRIGACNM